MTTLLSDIRRLQAEAADAHSAAASYMATVMADPTFRQNFVMRRYAIKWQERAAWCFRKIETLQEDYARQCSRDDIARRAAVEA